MFSASIKQIEPMTVAFIQMSGPFDRMPEAFGRLYEWTQRNGHTPQDMPRTVYMHGPGLPLQDAAWEVRVPIESEAPDVTPGPDGLGIKRLEPVTVAAAVHRGPYGGIEPTWRALEQWVVDNGFGMSGPPEELYLTDPDEVPPEEYLTEIRFPVLPK